MENNRSLILYIYHVLTQHSNTERYLNASQISRYIKEEFNLVEEPNRKTIYSHLKQLKELSDLGLLNGELLSVEQNNKVVGHYIIPDFTKSEIKLLCDAVASSRFISKTYSKELISKLSASYGKEFANKYNHILESKSNNHRTYNADFFDSIEELSDAIEKHKKVTFQYLQYDLNKNLEPKYTENNGYITVSPYYLIWAINHYYLFCKPVTKDERRFLRVDKIRNVVISEDKIEPLPAHFNIHDYSRNQAFMFGGENETIRFRCQMRMLGQVIDFFGEDVSIKPLDQEFFEVTVFTSIDSIKYWVLQYITAIDQIRPVKLRNIIADYLEDAIARINHADK